MKNRRFWTKFLLVLALTMLGFCVMGYHPGAEDDGVYLAAVKADLRPGLYPHDAAFFRLQLQATVFDGAMAVLVDTTGISVAWAELLGQVAALFGMLWAAHGIAARLFQEVRAQWAGVALLAAMFTLPVAGTALYIADQHLHPRNVAAALILLAVGRVLARRWMPAALLLVAALAMHPIMAALGISFCCVLGIVEGGAHRWLRNRAHAAAILGVLPGWVFQAPSPTWREALETRDYYFLSRWTWFEWVGVIAPLVLFAVLARWAQRLGETRLARFATAVVVYGVFQQIVATVMLETPALVRLTPLQPMRYLHLIYVFLVLMGGCLLGRWVLQTKAWRWAVVLGAAGAGMFAWQRVEFAHSPHMELPGRASGNAWLEAFAWVRENTPEDAYFALDPRYLEAPGEDFHSFRALAERSQLADAVKDTAVVTQVPELGPEWKRETEALRGWKQFQLQDFERIKTTFGVGWVVVQYPAPAGLKCRWHNDAVAVCPLL